MMKFGGIGVAVCLLWSVAIDLPARDSIRVNRVIKPVARWIDERDLELCFTSLMSMDIRSVYRYRIEPIYCEKDTCVAEFPSLLYFTRQGKRYFRRRQASEVTVEPFAVYDVLVKNSRYEDSLYHYTDTMRLGGGYRENGEIRFRYWLADCCCEYLLDSTCIAVAPMAYPVQPVEISPTVQTEQVEQLDLYLNYPLNRTEIYPDYMDNKAKLYELSMQVKTILTDYTRYKLNRIVIEGYASPEGKYTHNVDLSTWRAKAFGDYLIRFYGVPREIIQTVGAAENWQGLYEAVQADTLVPYQEEVLRLLAPKGTLQIRPCKNELQQLHKGKSYAYLLRHIYPHLRKVTMKVYYIEEKK